MHRSSNKGYRLCFSPPSCLKETRGTPAQLPVCLRRATDLCSTFKISLSSSSRWRNNIETLLNRRLFHSSQNRPEVTLQLWMCLCVCLIVSSHGLQLWQRWNWYTTCSMSSYLHLLFPFDYFYQLWLWSLLHAVEYACIVSPPVLQEPKTNCGLGNTWQLWITEHSVKVFAVSDRKQLSKKLHIV